MNIRYDNRMKKNYDKNNVRKLYNSVHKYLLKRKRKNLHDAIVELKMTEVSVETCFLKSKLWCVFFKYLSMCLFAFLLGLQDQP